MRVCTVHASVCIFAISAGSFIVIYVIHYFLWIKTSAQLGKTTERTMENSSAWKDELEYKLYYYFYLD